MVDLESHAMMCTCRPCYLLFTDATAHLRYRSVPDRYLSFPDFELGPGQWDELEIPVGLAFFFRSSKLDRTVAFYPSPAGATESELPLGAWGAVLARKPGAGPGRTGHGGPVDPRPGPGPRRSPTAISSPSTPATNWSASCAASGGGSTAARRPASSSPASSSGSRSRSRPAPSEDRESVPGGPQ